MRALPTAIIVCFLTGIVLAATAFDIALFAKGSRFYAATVTNSELHGGLDAEAKASISYYLSQKAWLKDEKHMSAAEITLFDEGVAIADQLQKDVAIEFTASDEHLLATFCCAVQAFDIPMVTQEFSKKCAEHAFKRLADRKHNNALLKQQVHDAATAVVEEGQELLDKLKELGGSMLNKLAAMNKKRKKIETD